MNKKLVLVCEKSRGVLFSTFVSFYRCLLIFQFFFCETAFVSYIFFEIPGEKLARARAGQNFSPRLTAVLILNEVERLRES